MSIILGLLGDFWPYVAGGFALFAAFLMGGSRQKTKQVIRKAKADENTHARINKVTPVDPADRRDIRERLRKLGK